MPLVMNDFFERLEQLLEIKGMFRAELCRGCGVADSTIRQWKKGSVPNADAVCRIAEYLNVTTDFLLLGTNPQADNITETKVTIVENEEELLKTFRALQDADKERLLKISKTFL